jgi:ribose transport system permease protein
LKGFGVLRNILRRLFKHNIASVVLAIIVLSIIFTTFTDSFASGINLSNLMKTCAVTIAVGLAQLCVLSVGQFNLALGSIGCMTAMTFGWCVQEVGMFTGAAVGVTVATGFGMGFFQGLLIVKTKMNPFIVTLALSSIYLGLATAIFKGSLLNRMPQSLLDLNIKQVAGIPVLFLLSLVLIAVMFIVMNKLRIGRCLLATGASERAALIAGMRPQRQLLIAHSMSGLLAAIAGLLTLSRLGAAQLTLGSEWMLISFAAPVLGGTLLSGGKVSVVGTLFGAALLSIINNGLILIRVNMYWTQVFLGSILVISFAVDYMRGQLFLKGEKL